MRAKRMRKLLIRVSGCLDWYEEISSFAWRWSYGSSYPIMDELLDTFGGYIKALAFWIQRKTIRESMARMDPQNTALRWGVVVSTTTPHRSSSSGKWLNPAMFCKPYSSILLWIVHLKTPNISPIWMPIHAILPTSHQECQNVVFQEFPFPHFLTRNNFQQQFNSGVTGLMAMWWFKDDNTCTKASASESSSFLFLVPISRQSLIDLLSTMHLPTPI